MNEKIIAMKRQRKRNKGITLIALVITVIVLLILAGISIATLIGENGILKNAKQAEKESDFSRVKEKLSILLGDYSIERTINHAKFYDYFWNKKQNNEIQEITDNYDGTYWIEIEDYEFLVRKKDLAIIEENKINGERPIVTHKFIREENSGKIELHVTTNDKEGIKRVIKPDGTVVEYNNKEKEISIEYSVFSNGSYDFKVESGNLRKNIYVVEVADFALYDEIYEENRDYKTVKEIYEIVKKEKGEEQNDILRAVSTLGYNSDMRYTEKNEQNNSWTIWGQDKEKVLDGYYEYSKHNVDSKTIYKEGSWSSWVQGNVQLASNKYGGSSYLFNTNTGKFTVSAYESFRPWTNQYRYGPIQVHGVSTFTPTKEVAVLTEYWTTGSLATNPRYTRTKRAIATTTKTKGSYIGDALLESTYPADGVKDNYWYTKKKEVKEYITYKYHNNEIKSSYNPITRVIETATIKLNEERENIKVQIESDNMDYKLLLLDSSGDWKEIVNNSSLDNGEIIDLSQNSSEIKLRIELHNSKIKRIFVNDV